MNRYYTDIDFVLHYYANPFFQMASTLYGIEIDKNSVTEEEIRKIFHMRDGLSHHSTLNGMSYEQIEECVRYTDHSKKWEPTSFGRILGNFLGKKRQEGHEVIAVTARKYDRPAAQEIVKQALGFSVPVFCCDTLEKHLIIHDHGCEKAFYFEDHPIAAKNVAEKFREESKVFVPDWPWNRKYIQEAYKELSNLILIHPKDIIEKFGTDTES